MSLLKSLIRRLRAEPRLKQIRRISKLEARARAAAERIRTKQPGRQSFLIPFDDFRHEDALIARLHSAFDNIGPLKAGFFRGKRILCLVEAKADTTMVRRYFDHAAAVEFLTADEHAGINRYVGEREHWRNPIIKARHWENMLPTTGAEERWCADQDLKVQHAFREFFDRAFSSDERLTPYRPYGEVFTVYAEALIYQVVFFLNQAIQSLIDGAKPDIVIVLCRDGSFWSNYLPFLQMTMPLGTVFVGATTSRVASRVGIVQQVAARWTYLQRRLDKGSLDALKGKTKGTEAERFSAAVDELAKWVTVCEAAAAHAVYKQEEPLRIRRPYGVINTEESESVGYNYRFRSGLLKQLGERFDLISMSYGVPDARHAGLKAELAAARHHPTDIAVGVQVSPQSGAMVNAVTAFLEATRFDWERSFLAAGMTKAMLPSLDLVAFDLIAYYIGLAFDYITFTEAFFRVHPPAFAMAITGEAPSGALLLRVAGKFKVPTFDMQIVAFLKEPRCQITLAPKADHFFAMDEPAARVLAEWGWPKDSIYLNGIPRFQEVVGNDQQKLRKAGRERLKVASTRPAKKVVLFVSQALSVEFAQRAVKELARFMAKRRDCILVVKPHPREVRGSHDVYEHLLRGMMPKSNFAVVSDAPIDELIAAADLVVGMYSLALLEAGCVGKPVIAVNLLNTRYPDPVNFSDMPIIEGADSEKELVRKSAALLDDVLVRNDYLIRQEAYLARHSYMVDRKTVERIAWVISDVLDGVPPRATTLRQWDDADGHMVRPSLDDNDLTREDHLFYDQLAKRVELTPLKTD